MAFVSGRFVLFFFVLVAALAITPTNRARKLVLAFASSLFYAAWDWRYLGLLYFISGVDYACAAGIHRSQSAPVRKALLALSIVSNLGVLGYFKYYNFFVGNLNWVSSGALELALRTLVLPAGISFYTFKSMSYTIDVYRGQIEPCRSWLDYVTFITFFPELIAGPIVRASVFLPQLDEDRRLEPNRAAEGASLFLLGLTKKVLLADNLALTVSDPVFAAPAQFASSAVWAAVLAYTIQIYADFSGYSDMAIGVAKILGYDLPENFHMPYLSENPSDFWRRWHVTLSGWLRDYLYIPLGGNRVSNARTYANLAATMLLGGLWHGASWNFVLWGALHGGALALHRFAKKLLPPMPCFIAQPLMLLFVMACWVPFRAQSLQDTWAMWRAMVVPSEGAIFTPGLLYVSLGFFVVGHAVGWAVHSGRAVGLLRFFHAERIDHPVSGAAIRLRTGSFWGAALVAAWVMTVFFLGAFNNNPFIYFQF